MATTTGNVVSTYFCPEKIPYFVKDKKYFQSPSIHFQYAVEHGYTVTHWMLVPKAPSQTLREALRFFLVSLEHLELISNDRYGEYFNVHILKGISYTSLYED
jgi:hypothetical protein